MSILSLSYSDANLSVILVLLTRIDRYPGPTLRALELLQQEQFRKDILITAVVQAMVDEGFEAATTGLNR